ncbi:MULTISPECIES: hypothetical protein [unclassified Polynucleobacter]|jgi:hypothetical protein|uniref:hypothetical protein n=1 Tax=unclassified Polynucleobacter TaxID=2640945 RepID=UPI001BFD8443|nr:MULTISPECIES: hypothetical protein [unclassified Polynucleobacter]MBU3606794.1 hypothetical protein [Polynucleobacter sp. MWH-Creno-3A4]QWD78759.1 hypothetical protein C2757_04255 [Polynucleobacter sp. MWH-Svant-W18]
MNTPSTAPGHSEGFKQKIENEAKQALALTLYFGAWFCALAFLGATTLDERPIPLSIFGIAMIKAGLCAKFMLIAQAIFPINITKSNGIIKSLFYESLLYIIVVLALNYVEAGVEGLFHGKSFFNSLSAFGERNPLKVLAMSIVYWLIVWPYLVFIGMKMALGSNATVSILFGKKKSVEH